MSKLFTSRYNSLVPYTPGEQPQDKQYVKLNTNESPFPPSQKVGEALKNEAASLRLYSDPECVELRSKMSEVFGVSPDNIIMTNGSDEILNFAFMAFADEKSPLAFPNITYGFYPVFAQLNHIPYEEIPLKDDFSLCAEDYVGLGKTIVIANPNAPTGKAISLEEIEKIVKSNPNNAVIVDEAYVDFGAESAVCLTEKYDNLLVTGTFSKSRSTAGMRLGFGIGNEELIRDINTIKYSTNPYNVSRLASKGGIAILEENDYYMDNCKKIIENRQWTTRELEALDFSVLDSKANFVFAKCSKIEGRELYLRLKEKGVLIRHFDRDIITDYNRITIGSREQMEILITKIKEIREEKGL